ncbi:MAG: 1,4-dihydroxy-2-naphthoate polyprenyltransferase [Micrococcales bacterium]
MAKKSLTKAWLTGARLRTLPLAVTPVLLGAASAQTSGRLNLTLTLLAAAVALLLQIGVNYANDYSDGIRGTDANRVGPTRITASGLVRPKSVKLAAFISFALAAIAGLAITWLTGYYWFIAVGLVCIIAAWYYTGGKHPYGYAGLGELAVFVFFGLVATIGTSFIQEGIVNPIAVLLGVSSGFFASAVLMVNNLRDIETDRIAKKRTLAVKVGKSGAKFLFFVMLWLPVVVHALAVLLIPKALISYAAIFLIAPTTLIVATAKTAKELILALKLTSFAALVYALFTLLSVLI